MNPEDIRSKLVFLAKSEKEAGTAVARLELDRNLLNDRIRKIKEGAEQIRAEVLKALMEYIQSTGDLEPDPHITFVRSFKIQYDPADILQYMTEHNQGDMLRVKVELDVRAFEAAWKEGKFLELQVERTPAPYLRLSPLGDLLFDEEDTNGTHQD